MRKLFFLSSLLIFQTIASAAPNLIFASSGTTNLFIAKDTKIRIVGSSFSIAGLSVQHAEMTYEYAGNDLGGLSFFRTGDELIGPVTLTLDSKGIPSSFAYEVIPTLTEVVVFTQNNPNSASLPDSALYRLGVGIRDTNQGATPTFFKTIDMEQVEVEPFSTEGFDPGRSVDWERTYPGPGTVTPNQLGAWAVFIFEKIPYNPPGTQSATVQIQKSPDLTTWSDLTNISVQTNQPNTYLRFKVGE
jgi:hypothetical protein